MDGYPPETIFRHGTQKRKIYDALLQGQVSNVQMSAELDVLKYTGRISEMTVLPVAKNGDLSFTGLRGFYDRASNFI